MYANSKCYLVVCFALSGCVDAIDAEPGLETEESATGTTEQGLAASHFDSHPVGGNIFSAPFGPYVTQQFDPAGDCSPGTVHALLPRVEWTSASGGWCAFMGWLSPDVHNCRAIIHGGTGGGWFGGTCTTVVDEIPELPPGAQGVFSFNVSNTNSAQVNTTNFAIALNAGQNLTVGTCGMAGASFNGDTFLRLSNLSLSGIEVAANDDACSGLGSKLVFTASSGGSFVIRAGCFSSGNCNGTVAWTIQ